MLKFLDKIAKTLVLWEETSDGYITVACGSYWKRKHFLVTYCPKDQWHLGESWWFSCLPDNLGFYVRVCGVETSIDW